MEEQLEIVGLESGLKGISSYWPLFILRGTITLFFGFLLLVFPETSIATFSIIFGIYAILDSISCLAKLYITWMFVEDRKMPLALLYFLNFTCNLITGIFSIAYPDLSTKILLVLIALWFVLIGVLELLLACYMRGDPSMSGTGLICTFLGGAMYSIFGIVLLSNVKGSVLGIARLIGVIIMVFAFQVIFFGFRLRTSYKGTANTNGADQPIITTNPSTEVV